MDTQTIHNLMNSIETIIYIEQYRSEDFKEVKKLLSYICETEIEQSTLEKRYIDSTHFILIAKVLPQNTVAGCALVEKRDDYVRNSSILYLTYLATHVNFRGKGVGKMLIKEIEMMCKKMGCSAIELTSANFRVEAHSFYKALGFTAKKTTHFIKENSNLNHNEIFFETNSKI